jgi:hypothetical protein
VVALPLEIDYIELEALANKPSKYSKLLFQVISEKLAQKILEKCFALVKKRHKSMILAVLENLCPNILIIIL